MTDPVSLFPACVMAAIITPEYENDIMFEHPVVLALAVNVPVYMPVTDCAESEPAQSTAKQARTELRPAEMQLIRDGIHPRYHEFVERSIIATLAHRHFP